VKNRDEYLFNYVKDKIQEEYKYVLEASCRRQQHNNKLMYWLRHKDVGIATWITGNGTFATASGEILYQYRCQPVYVKAVTLNDGQCYQALPVKPEQPTTAWMFEKQTYMEPLTHRLTHQGVPVPCSRQFAPNYMNVHGVWVNVYPTLQAVNAPEIAFSEEAFEHQPIAWDNLDFSKGGIYTEEDLDHMERFQDFSRTVTALSSTLRKQLSSSYVNGPLTAGMLFPELNLPEDPFVRFARSVKTFFHWFGEIAAIFMAINVLVRLFYNCGQWFYEFAMLQEAHGFVGAVLRTTFFECFMARTYRDSDQAQLAKEERTEARRIAERQKAERQEELNRIRQKRRTHYDDSELPEHPHRALSEEVSRMKEQERNSTPMALTFTTSSCLSPTVSVATAPPPYPVN